ncbi:hypothetical protein J3P71_19335 [Rhizobium leguminosarum]|uniref:lysozyme inhibitor LprI family protein n=1 Tax=Rhizobium leguminosarum TaxID=384 RepID=UPI001441C14C|nr:hypothetical protein [Rhizobium leguminosarum]MBY5841092.1 hypothetical protein [Rhizobium leguminosarum]NKM80411.1 hypothetical protein [Rhizobium leguminosarum bv. viciae]QSZ07010.1 hypothetical protein J3P71_19335 [Rhizobium leguminosarum]
MSGFSRWLGAGGGLLASLLICSAAEPASAAQTFECQRASGQAQAMICDDASLLALDRELGDLVEKLRAKSDKGQRAQQKITDRLTKWQVSLNARCGSRRSCLTRAYKQGITNLRREVAQFERRETRRPATSEVVPIPDKYDKGRVIAKLFRSDKWSYTGGDVAAEVTAYANGSGMLRIEVIAESGAFKYFAEPHGVLVVADATGRIVAEASVSELSMRMGSSGLFSKRNFRTAAIKAAEFGTATYAFLGFKYCGWRQTFERNVGENNGCYQSSLRAEYRAFVADLPKALPAISANVGEKFSILEWQGIKLR